MVQKAKDLLFIEKNMERIQQNSGVDVALDSITRTVRRRYDINLDIHIITNKRGSFFGMTIYPSMSTMDKMVEAMLNNKSHGSLLLELWKESKDWVLEIDSIALYDRNLNTNPAELTAMLLHEIGHIVFANTVPQRVERIVAFEMQNLNYRMRELCRRSMVNKLFELSIIEACSQIGYNYVRDDSEIDADKFVVKEGYGDELNNFITKLISTRGAGSVNRDKGEKDKEVEIMVKWAIDNVTELRLRKTKLKHLIDVQTLKTPSTFVRGVLSKIKDTFVKKEGDAYREAIAEQTLFASHDRIVREGILDFIDNIGKVKKIKQVDVDVLSVQIDKMENQDDKIYMLDQVYDKLELVNTALTFIDDGKTNKVSQSKQTLIAFKSQLEKMRAQILDCKVKEKKYGMFIKYPAGYEG